MDVLKDLNDTARGKLLNLLNEWWIKKEVPEDILTAKVFSLYKKGNASAQENYRPLSLLSSLYKVFAAILKERIEEGLRLSINNTQFGFMKSKSTSQALHIVRRVISLFERSGKVGHMLFLDWSKAFDKVVQSKLIEILIEKGVDKHLIQLVGALYKKTTFVVEANDVISSKKMQSTGIRQGCPLSPFLFIVLLDGIMEKVYLDPRCPNAFHIPCLRNYEVLYADDTTLMSTNNTELQTFLHLLEEYAEAYGLVLNQKKCVHIALNSAQRIR